MSAWAGTRAVELDLPKRKGSVTHRPLPPSYSTDDVNLAKSGQKPSSSSAKGASVPQFSVTGFAAYRQLEPAVLSKLAQHASKIMQLESLGGATNSMIGMIDDLIRMTSDQSIMLQFNIEDLEHQIQKIEKAAHRKSAEDKAAHGAPPPSPSLSRFSESASTPPAQPEPPLSSSPTDAHLFVPPLEMDQVNSQHHPQSPSSLSPIITTPSSSSS